MKLIHISRVAFLSRKPLFRSFSKAGSKPDLCYQNELEATLCLGRALSLLESPIKAGFPRLKLFFAHVMLLYTFILPAVDSIPLPSCGNSDHQAHKKAARSRRHTHPWLFRFFLDVKS
jgi:hypothetical protein